MKMKEFRALQHGAYRVYWKSGGSSVATIGSTYDGGRWIACANWINPATWEQDVKNAVRSISSVSLIEPVDYKNDGVK
jgi:hypothetical protein